MSNEIQKTGTKGRRDIMLQDTQKKLSTLIASKMDAMPKDFNETRFLQNCMSVLVDTKDIEKYSAISVARALLKGAFLGLDFFNKECYVIGAGNDVRFQTDYKGDIKYVKKHSRKPIKDIYAKVVKEGDFYETGIEYGKQYVNFKPLPFNNNKIIGAFAVVIFEDGVMKYEEMTTEEIEDIRKNFSKQANGLMWTKTPSEAYKKTVSRRLTKMIDVDFEHKEHKEAFENGGDLEIKSETQAPPPNPFANSEIIEGEFEVSEASEAEAEPQAEEEKNKSKSKKNDTEEVDDGTEQGAEQPSGGNPEQQEIATRN